MELNDYVWATPEKTLTMDLAESHEQTILKAKNRRHWDEKERFDFLI